MVPDRAEKPTGASEETRVEQSGEATTSPKLGGYREETLLLVPRGQGHMEGLLPGAESLRLAKMHWRHKGKGRDTLYYLCFHSDYLARLCP